MSTLINLKVHLEFTLEDIDKSGGSDSLDDVVTLLDEETFLGLSRESLEGRKRLGLLTLLDLLSSLAEGLVDGADVLDVSLVAVGVRDVLDADVDALADDPVADLLVDLNTDGALGDVPDAAGATVVEGVGHAFLDGAVGLDVDVVPELVGLEVGLEAGHSVLTEGAGEFAAGACSVTVGVRHFSWLSFFSRCGAW